MGSFAKLVNAITEGVKVNRAWREVRAGQTVWCKQRRALGGPILSGANAFFRLAGAPVEALANVREWQAWEIESFQALHGAEGFSASREGATGVSCTALPGENLTNFLDGGTMTPAMAAAAGRELRRAHALPSALFGGGWSHGDAHAGNFVYDAAQDRARLIDFELRHRRTLSTAAREEDDLLGFLLDMVGRIEAVKWPACAEAFLRGYGSTDATAAIMRNLPGGGIWLRIRTTFLAREEFHRRWADFRKVGQVMPGQD